MLILLLNVSRETLGEIFKKITAVIFDCC